MKVTLIFFLLGVVLWEAEGILKLILLAIFFFFIFCFKLFIDWPKFSIHSLIINYDVYLKELADEFHFEVDIVIYQFFLLE